MRVVQLYAGLAAAATRYTNCYGKVQFIMPTIVCRNNTIGFQLNLTRRLSDLRLRADVKHEQLSVDETCDANVVDISSLCCYISRRLDKGGLMESFVTEDERQNIIELLLSSKIPVDAIKVLLPEHPVLLKHSHAVWTDTISFLKSYSFQPHQLLPLIAGSPALLLGSSRKILLDVLALLRSSDVSEGKRQTIVAGNTQLLISEDLRPIRQLQAKLLSVFTKAELRKLMLVTPCILTDSWDETRSKIEYVYSSMGIRTTEMTNSRLFSHTLLHIVARHQFAVRTGVYLKPRKQEIAAREKGRPMPSEMRNPTLRQLVDSSDVAFVRIIGDLSVDEYHTFVAMMAAEMEKTELNNDSEGTDSDGDDEEEETDVQ